MKKLAIELYIKFSTIIISHEKIIFKKVVFNLPSAINPSRIDFFVVAFDERIPNMPSQTCENAYFLKKTRFSEKLKIDLKS